MSFRIRELNYYYNKGTSFEIKALKNINLDIKDGEFIGLIGASGSGKSTLLQHFNALLKGNDGYVYFNDKNIYDKKYDLKKLRRKVGFVFQNSEHQLFEKTVLSDISFGIKYLNLSKEEIKEKVEHVLTMVGLDKSYMIKSPFMLSCGEKKRVALAGILIMQPEILLLDEPTANLDPRGRDEILSQISKLNKTLGITIILASHNLEEIIKYANRVLVMHDGEILYDKSPEYILKIYDKLEEVGIETPQLTKLMCALKQKGFDVRIDVKTIEEAKKVLLNTFKDVKN